MKKITIGLLFAYLFTSNLYAQGNKDKLKSEADSTWAQLLKKDEFTEIITKDNVIQYFMQKETYRLKYRKEGLKFWIKYPNDIRRYEWLSCKLPQK